MIAPPAILDALEKAAKIVADRSQRIGIGVAVRPGAALPDISSQAAVGRALLEADSVVYNRASTGLYFETRVKKMGLEAQLAPKTKRLPDGAAVMKHLLRGQGREIGFGATTEILLLREQGLQFVGPLPPELQKFTTYTATATTAVAQPEAAQALLRHLASPASRAGYVAAGIAAPP